MDNSKEQDDSLEDLMRKFANRLDQDLEKIDQDSPCQSSDQSNNHPVTKETHTASGNMITENGTDNSLLSVMTEFAEQLDKDSVKLSNHTDQQSAAIETNSSLASFLSKVADKMDRDGQSEDPAFSKDHESQELLQDMMRNLHRGIKHSDWLKENTAEKWTSENPDFAKEFMEAASKGNPS